MSYEKNLLIFGVMCISMGLLAQVQCRNVATNEIVQTQNGVDIYHRDDHCALIGGDCVKRSECVVPSTNRGLCPSNAHRGVECCFEIKLKALPCSEHYGECMDRCPRGLVRPSTDCSDGAKCCVLV